MGQRRIAAAHADRHRQQPTRCRCLPKYLQAAAMCGMGRRQWLLPRDACRPAPAAGRRPGGPLLAARHLRQCAPCGRFTARLRHQAVSGRRLPCGTWQQRRCAPGLAAPNAAPGSQWIHRLPVQPARRHACGQPGWWFHCGQRARGEARATEVAALLAGCRRPQSLHVLAASRHRHSGHMPPATAWMGLLLRQRPCRPQLQVWRAYRAGIWQQPASNSIHRHHHHR